MKYRKKTDLAEIVIRALIVIAVAAATVMCAVIFTILNNKTIKREISRRATDKMISEAASRLGEYDEDGEEPAEDEVGALLDEMTESDRNRIADIVQNHMDAETLSEMAKALSKGDEEKLEAFAKENLTRTEQHDLMKIAEKYGLLE